MMRPVAGRPTWLEIDAAALARNVVAVKRRLPAGCLLMAVVKANAYGHGALATTQAFLAAGADCCAVATLEEGRDLRADGVRAPILVLGYTPGYLAAEAVQEEIALTVVDLETARAIDAAAAALGKRAAVHVKVNTGMNRLGIAPEDAPEFLAALAGLPHVTPEGIFTHFATSDTDRAYAAEQFGRFEDALARLDAAGLRPRLAHAANSAAMLTMPETHLDMVRCGIALYGLDPDVDDTPLPEDFAPALSWKAQIAQVRQLQPGDPVSYGREFVAADAMMVATIPVGYGDGFPRRPLHWGSVLVHGEFAPILGRVCMDQCVVDVTAQARREPVRQGDEVVLIGVQGARQLTAAEVGRRIGTINYDVVTRILARVPRVMVDGRNLGD